MDSVSARRICSATAADCENPPTMTAQAARCVVVNLTPSAKAPFGPMPEVSYTSDRVQAVAKRQSGIGRGVSVGRHVRRMMEDVRTPTGGIVDLSTPLSTNGHSTTVPAQRN